MLLNSRSATIPIVISVIAKEVRGFPIRIAALNSAPIIVVMRVVEFVGVRDEQHNIIAKCLHFGGEGHNDFVQRLRRSVVDNLFNFELWGMHFLFSRLKSGDSISFEVLDRLR